jgi:hypothetical protein
MSSIMRHAMLVVMMMVLMVAMALMVVVVVMGVGGDHAGGGWGQTAWQTRGLSARLVGPPSQQT